MISSDFALRTNRHSAAASCLALLVSALLTTSIAGQEPSAGPDSTVAANDQPADAHGAASDGSERHVTTIDGLSEAEQQTQRTLEIVTYLWFLALGSAIGSFLNVVIYRLPHDRPLIGRSRCPKCDEGIEWRDNIPVLGWLRLLGRCRVCSARIPARYPAVELLIGGLFVLLLGVELLSGGRNLPVRTPNNYAGVVWIIWYTKWDLLGTYLFHCCLGCVLIAAALIQWDGHPLPRRLNRFAIATGLIAPVFWRHLHPVSFHEPRLRWLSSDWRWQVSFMDPISGWRQHFGVGLDGLADSVAGLATGLATGWLIARCLGASAFPESARQPHDDSRDVEAERATREHARGFVALFGVAGTFLGWQAVAPLSISVSAIAIVMSVVAGITGDPRWRRQTTSAAIAAAVLIQLLFWRTLSTLEWSPDHTGWPLVASDNWWPLSGIEPCASLALVIATGCVIAGLHSPIANLASPGGNGSSTRLPGDNPVGPEAG